MNMDMIGGTTIAKRLEGYDGDLEGMVRLAMERAWTDDTWYTANGDDKLRAALAAVLLATKEDPEAYRRIELSIQQMRDLNALLSGVPVDPEAMLAKYEDANTVPIVGLWQEALAKDRDRWKRKPSTDTEGTE